MQNRIRWIDIARGIFILAIVLGHVFFYDGSQIRWYVYSFHVPAFFFISGYCFRFRNDFISFFHSRTTRIVVPYFLLSFIYIAAFAVATNVIPAIGEIYHFDFLQSIKTLLFSNYNIYPMKYNVPLWFLPCLFIVELISYCTEKIIHNQNKKNFYRIIICGLSVILGAVFKYNLPWHIETALAMLVWYNLGIICCRTNIVEFTYHKLGRNKTVVLVVVLLTLGLITPFFNWTNVSVLRNLYGQYPIYYLSCICSIFGYVFLSILINNCRLLEYCGRNSLSILAFHKVPIIVFQYILVFTKHYLNAPDSLMGFLIGIVVWIVSVTTSVAIGEIVGKLFPILIGKRKQFVTK